MSTWGWIVAEFKALGLWCIVHGPEFWLVIPSIVGAVALAALIGWIYWRN